MRVLTFDPKQTGAVIGPRLTAADIDRLLQEGSTAVREEIVIKVAGPYCGGEYSGSEQQLAEEIFRLMMKDLDWRVRRQLSMQLRRSSNLPQDIVESLIQDIEEVAVPMLETYQQLTDAQLTAVVRYSLTTGKPLAIAGRQNLSADICNALIDFGEPVVLERLLNNDSADMKPGHYNELAHRFSRVEPVMQALVKRQGIPQELIEKIADQIASELCGRLCTSFPESAVEIRRSIQVSKAQVLEDLQRDAWALNGQLYDLHNRGGLTNNLLLLSLCQGNLAFFVMAMACRAKIPVTNALALLDDKGQRGFEALYKKGGLPEGMRRGVQLLFRAHVALLLQGMSPEQTEDYTERFIALVESQASARPVPGLEYLLALVRYKISYH